MPDLAALTKIIEPEAQTLGFDLVRVAWFANGIDGADMPVLQIMAERPDTRQISAEECASLSRRVSEQFDVLDPIEEHYVLQVSSPGIDRPLTRQKDFTDWAGHEAKIEIDEPIEGQKRFRGDLNGIAVEGEVISLTDDSGKQHFIPFTAVVSAKLVLTDLLIASTAPINSDGAEEFETEDQS